MRLRNGAWKRHPNQRNPRKNMKQVSNPKQVRAIDRMVKRGFVVDYTILRNFNPAVHMTRVANGIKRFAEVSVDGMVNGRPEMAFV